MHQENNVIFCRKWHTYAVPRPLLSYSLKSDHFARTFLSKNAFCFAVPLLFPGLGAQKLKFRFAFPAKVAYVCRSPRKLPLVN